MASGTTYKRFDVYLTNLDPTVGSEIRKIRPCVIISPDQMNRPLNTVIVAPLTTSLHAYPFRVPSTFQGMQGMVALDHVRSVDKRRLIEFLGRMNLKESRTILEKMAVIYAFGDPDKLR